MTVWPWPYPNNLVTQIDLDNATRYLHTQMQLLTQVVQNVLTKHTHTHIISFIQKDPQTCFMRIKSERVFGHLEDTTLSRSAAHALKIILCHDFWHLNFMQSIFAETTLLGRRYVQEWLILHDPWLWNALNKRNLR